MNEVTQILSSVERGESDAARQLLPLVYDELRRLAAYKLSLEKPGQTLQATALVHEAYLRLVGGDQEQSWKGRRHFFAAAAEAMRRILVDRARRKQSTKRGGGLSRVDLHAAEFTAQDDSESLLVVDDALTRLAAQDGEAARLVELRYFAGLTIPQAAEVLGVSPRTADRLWAYARAWLLQELQDK